ncbi:MAG: sulfate/molybdate ABC transporter ATP-binding protein [Pirellulales bacterium]
MSIAVHHVTKRFGNFAALDGVSLTARSGELLALLGPSGSGKTTLLRVIAGLEAADRGSVHYHDEDVTARSARERNVGFVFQHYALFRHMNVFENVAFGLRVRGVRGPTVDHRVRELLRLVRLESLERRYPSQLSGGQRQRVALARALAVQPKVLLLDEPFGALDAKVRVELRQWLRRLHEEIHMTSVFVTHDQEEAFEVADRVAVMHRGRIEQLGSPQEVFDQPANSFVMRFLGNVNVFHGRVQQGKALLGQCEVALPEHADVDANAAAVYVRPHELEIERAPALERLPARVVRVHAAGPVAKVALRSDDFGLEIQVELNVERCAALALRPGEVVHVSPRRVRVFVPDELAADAAAPEYAI